ARDVQALLLRLGINARVSRVSQGATGRDHLHLDISGNTDQEGFTTLLGIAGARKQAILEQVHSHLALHVANTTLDVLPLTNWEASVKPARAVWGMTERQLQAAIGFAYCGDTLYEAAMSRAHPMRAASVLHSEERILLAASDVYWDRVARLELDGEEP